MANIFFFKILKLLSGLAGDVLGEIEDGVLASKALLGSNTEEGKVVTAAPAPAQHRRGRNQKHRKGKN